MVYSVLLPAARDSDGSSPKDGEIGASSAPLTNPVKETEDRTKAWTKAEDIFTALNIFSDEKYRNKSKFIIVLLICKRHSHLESCKESLLCLLVKV